MFRPNYVQDWAAVHNLCPDLPHLSQTKLLLENTSLLCKLDQFHIFLWQMSQFYHKINTLKPDFSWQVTLFDLLNAFLTEQLLSISSSTAKSFLTLGIDTILRFFDQVGHQTTDSSMRNKHFSTKYHHQSDILKLWTEPAKIGHIFRQQSTLKIKVFKKNHL